MIPSLDPKLLFKVLAVAEGYAPAFLEKVDPLAGAARFTLARRGTESVAGDRQVNGRLTDPDGKPVVGATVSAEGFGRGSSFTYGGVARMGIDALSVTDGAGRFRLVSKNPVRSFQLRIKARGLAIRNFVLPSGEAPHELKLTRGASVTGRVLKDGKPLAGVRVGLVQVDRIAGEFVGVKTIGTDETGRFIFTNVSPNLEYFVYGKMEDFHGVGSLPVRRVKVLGDDTEAPVGDLPVQRAHRVSGRVVLADGKPLPARTRILLSRDKAWDSRQKPLSGDGSFEFDGVPEEIVSLSVRVRGYVLSKKNYSLRPTGLSLEGRVRGDLGGLEVLLEPGEPSRTFRSPPREVWDRFQRRRQESLRGVEKVDEKVDEKKE